MHPYRARIPRPLDNPATGLQAIARAAVLLTEIPLAAMVIAFFLPLTEKKSPLGLIDHGDLGAVFAIWPMHVGAAALLVLVERARRRHRARPRAGAFAPRLPVPSRRARGVAYGLVALSAVGSGVLVGYALKEGPDRFFPGWVRGVAIATILAAFVSLGLARWARGWQRWAFVILGYAASFSGIGLLYVRVAMEGVLAWGGFVVLAALGALYVLGIVSVSTRLLLWRHTRASRP